MRLSHFFIDRPIFASVLSIILTLVGAISFRALAITEFPDIAPPTVQVLATYAGAAADVVAETVSSPIEQEINGVDNMIYICLLYTSPSPRDRTRSRMPSSA